MNSTGGDAGHDDYRALDQLSDPTYVEQRADEERVRKDKRNNSNLTT
jgi:hypothetical protein